MVLAAEHLARFGTFAVDEKRHADAAGPEQLEAVRRHQGEDGSSLFCSSAMRSRSICREMSAEAPKRDRDLVDRLRPDAEALEVAVDEPGIELPCPETLRLAELLQEGHVGLRSGDDGFPERRGEPVQRLVARRAMGDDLRDHRIVIGRHLVPGLDAGIDADALALRKVQRPELAGRRQEFLLRILRIKARLDRVAVDGEILLREGQQLARGGAELQLDEIEPGDRLGHRMLHLQPGVHFHEVEAVGAQALATVGDELDRAGAHIADRAGGFDRRLAPSPRASRASCRARAPPRSPSDGGAAASSRARKMHHVAVAVGKDLDLDMARREDVFLHQHARIAEGVLRPRAGRSRAPHRNRPPSRRAACPCRHRRRPP